MSPRRAAVWPDGVPGPGRPHLPARRPGWQRAILLLSTAPIALLCNIVRVTATGLLYVLADPRFTQGVYHDLLGLAMLPLAFGLYGLLAWFMASLFMEDGARAGAEVIVRKRSGHE
jgi:exosortase/archaeosortase family protein